MSARDEQPSAIGLERIERWWVRFGIVMLAAFFLAVVVDATMTLRGVPMGEQHINPEKVTQTKPFDRPGIYRHSGKTYDVAIVASTFLFRPDTIRVPSGSTVRFHLATTDVVHGFLIPHTDVNAMVLPGYVTEVSQRFATPGRYLVVCSEYCGLDHQHMTMHVIVTKERA